VTVRKLLGAALAMPVLLGGVVLLTAGPATACTCWSPRSEAGGVARADAVFVGTLVSHVIHVDHKARELMASPDPAVAWRAFRNDSTRSVWTFQVSRVYKGAVGQRQEIITPPGAPGGSNCSGVGGLQHPGTKPLVVLAFSSGRRYRPQPGQYASNMCSGSRPLADGGEPAAGGLSARQPSGPDRPPSSSRGGLLAGASGGSASSPPSTRGGLPARAASGSASSPSPASLALGVGLLAVGAGAGLGLVILRARRRAGAD
jgi:hypothetical protein